MRHARWFAPAAILAISACSAEQDEPKLGEIELISFNALAPAALLDNGDALSALAGGPLDGAATELVDSEDGRMLLSYVARCALEAGDSVTFPRPNAPDLVFTGLVGIAPGWMGSSLNGTGQRLMTACLMAHVNALETQVPISVRSARLGTAPLVERLLFPAQEMAVYGNYFAPRSQRELHICFGEAVARSLGGGGGLGLDLGLPSYLDFRVCSVSEECGFNRVGACFRWPAQRDITRSACQVQSGSLYERCHEAPIEVETTPAWNETVSVYLQATDLALLLAEYLDLICELTGGDICELLPL